MEKIARLGIRSIRLTFLISNCHYFPLAKGQEENRHLRLTHGSSIIIILGDQKTCGADWTRSAPPNHRSKQTSRFEALETRVSVSLKGC
jgi:hypothetical protein